MNHWVWKIKEFFKKLIPLVILGAFAYGGFLLYKDGTFKRGLEPGVARLLSKVPYFGTRYHRSYRGSHVVVVQHGKGKKMTKYTTSRRHKGIARKKLSKSRKIKHRRR